LPVVSHVQTSRVNTLQQYQGALKTLYSSSTVESSMSKCERTERADIHIKQDNLVQC